MAEYPAWFPIDRRKLCPKQDQVRDLLSQGLTTIQIRERLGISKSAMSGFMFRIRAREKASADD